MDHFFPVQERLRCIHGAPNPGGSFIANADNAESPGTSPSFAVYSVGRFVKLLPMERSQIQLFTIIRDQSRALLAARDDVELMQTVPGLSNNMLWIFGHLVRTSDFLILKLSGQAVNFPSDLDALFAKGSSPSDWNDVVGLRDRLFAVEQDCQAKLLAFLETADADRPYGDPYVTSTGFSLSNVRESLRYNVVHEGIHLGQLQIYNKLLSV